MHRLKIAGLKARRPPSCGRRADIPNYFLWKIVHQQLWRFKNYSDESVSAEPYLPKVKTTPSKPIKGDLVSVDETKHGTVAYISYDSGEIEEISVDFNDGSTTDYDPGDFTTYVLHAGKRRWLLEGT